MRRNAPSSIQSIVVRPHATALPSTTGDIVQVPTRTSRRASAGGVVVGAWRPMRMAAARGPSNHAERHLLHERLARRLHRRPGRELRLHAPDEELHRFHNEQVRELSAHLWAGGSTRRCSTGRRPTRSRAPDSSSTSPGSGRRCRRSSSPRRSTASRATRGWRPATSRTSWTVLEDGAGGDVAIGGAGLAAAASSAGSSTSTAVRLPGRGRRRDAVLPAARVAARLRARRDAHVRVEGGLPPPPAPLGLTSARARRA